MEYTIVFRNADEVNTVLSALGQMPHNRVRSVIDNISQQAAAIEQKAQDEAVNKLIEEKKSEETTETVEESTIEEVETTDS